MLRAYSKSESTGKRGDRHPALVWAESGAMALTGTADGPPVLAPGGIVAAATGALFTFGALAGVMAIRGLDATALLAERAAFLGLDRRGTTSAGGSCRMLRARDGWLAVNLPRPDDRAMLPAWLGVAATDDPWDALAAIVATRAAAPLVARARPLGLAVAPVAPPPDAQPAWCQIIATGPLATQRAMTPPLVVDLSSLWAGPLAGHLLQRAGARVIKVESTRRPDGTRAGAPDFFDLLHAGKESVALDLTSATGRNALARLVAVADVVIESARPRALLQLGIDAAAVVAARPGTTWISITAYGRTGRAANWIGFGDDAACAAGLASATGAITRSPTPLFCADAIADPLTGMYAALAALGSYRQGGGALLSIALADVAAHALAAAPSSPASVRPRRGTDGTRGWEVVADGERQTVEPPRRRAATGTARIFGADTDAVLREIDGR